MQNNLRDKGEGHGTWDVRLEKKIFHLTSLVPCPFFLFATFISWNAIPEKLCWAAEKNRTWMTQIKRIKRIKSM